MNNRFFFCTAFEHNYIDLRPLANISKCGWGSGKEWTRIQRIHSRKIFGRRSTNEGNLLVIWNLCLIAVSGFTLRQLRRVAFASSLISNFSRTLISLTRIFIRNRFIGGLFWLLKSLVLGVRSGIAACFLICFFMLISAIRLRPCLVFVIRARTQTLRFGFSAVLRSFFVGFFMVRCAIAFGREQSGILNRFVYSVHIHHIGWVWIDP
jgi:hypothetical protein